MKVSLFLCLALTALPFPLVCPQPCAENAVRLRERYFYGILEVCQGGTWNTVCVPSSTNVDEVVCRQLGLIPAIPPVSRMSLCASDYWYHLECVHTFMNFFCDPCSNVWYTPNIIFIGWYTASLWRHSLYRYWASNYRLQLNSWKWLNLSKNCSLLFAG